MVSLKKFGYILSTIIIMVLFLAKPLLAVTTFSCNDSFMGQSGSIAMDRFAKLVEEKSKGDMKVKVFHRGEMGDEREAYNYLATGSLEMQLSANTVIAAITPEYGALDMPYIFRDRSHLRKVVQGPIGDTIRKRIFDRKGIIVLGVIDRAPRHLTTKNKIIRKPEDLCQ